MEFVKNFTLPDFQAKNFTPSISPNFNSFSKKKHKKLVKMEKFTPLATNFTLPLGLTGWTNFTSGANPKRMRWVQEKQRCAKVWKAPSALSSSLLLWAACRGIMKRRYHHFEQVFRQKLGQNLRQSSEAFSAFEAETCNCFRANSQYVEKLQWPWNSSSTLKRNSSSTNYFSNALPPPCDRKSS